MKREELIKKWLDNNLSTTEEQKAFEQLDDYKELTQMDGALKNFKAPDFAVEDNYKSLKLKLQSDVPKSNNWYKPLLKLVALLAIFFSVYYYTTTLDSHINTQIAEQTSIMLPDASSVVLNANSKLTYNKKHWEENRQVVLNGEAFFKVAKGKKFDVVTDEGTVRVLGTEFNVKQRKSFFEVTCFEGLVAVTHNNKTIKLKPGNIFKIIDGKLFANEKESTEQPAWLQGESSFKNIPLKHVIAELENQYGQNITINNDIDTSRLFTGSFTHKNLDLALQSITIPLNLSYSKSETTILLKRE